MKALRPWRLAAAAAALVLFAALFWLHGPEWVLPRRAALAPHVSTSLTHFGPKVAIALVLLGLTAAFGRWYCSLLCPAGLVQEAFSRLGAALGLRKLRYRATTLAGGAGPVLMLLFVTGFALIGNLAPADNMDPVALFGRIGLGLSDAAARRWPADGLSILVLAIAVVILIVLPVFRGRWFCATLCPVSGLLHQASMLPGRRASIDPEACVGCGRCADVCPTSCANAAAKRIDAARCVLCLDCAAVCPTDAVRYRAAPPPAGRRKFLDLAAVTAAGAAYAAARSLAPFARGDRPVRIAPPGSGGDERHRRRCITCQACVSSCPVGIIRPQGEERRPTLDFSRGYCQYNCIACSRSCPAGVFSPITLEDKHRTRVASTRLVLPHCVVVTRGVECGACAEVCPTHAVTMRPQGPGQPTVPDFDAEYCIGCGACYHVCPASPRAFSLTGLAVHERSLGVRPVQHGDATIAPPTDGELTDFPF